MEQITNICNNSTTVYSNKIKENNYTQGNNNKKEICFKSKDIVELLIYINNIKYNILDIKRKKVELYNYKCHLLKDIPVNIYDKLFTKKIILNGILDGKCLSSLYYIADYYKINIYILYDNYYYKSKINYEKDIYILFNGIDFINVKDISIDNYNKMSKDILFKILKNDLNNDKIYKLNSISNYKLDELKEIATKFNVVPRKLKKEIYDDILNIIKI